MPAFEYVARHADSGIEILNSIEAETQEMAIQLLHNRNQLVVAIQEKKSDIQGKRRGRKVRLEERVAFTRQLATLVDAGMAIVSCLKSLARQTQNNLMKEIVIDLSTTIEGGESFGDALAKHPKAFDNLYVSLVKAGEKSGLLAESLERLATYLESSEKLRRKVKSALMYPTVVMTVAFAVTTFLLVKVVPVFGEIYSGFHGKLPAPTQALITFSNFLKHWFPLFALGGVGIVFGWFRFIATKGGREFWDARRIKLPVFGHIAHKICLARFARTFSTLIKSGIPILSVLQTVAKICGNVVMEKAVNECAAEISLGSGVSESLAKRAVFPPMVIDMVAAGEQTGKMDEMLNRVADHYDDTVETALSGLTSLIEPLIIVFLGVVIGTIVICMFLPIFKLSDLVSGRG
jgi:type IV pilus assembly protein PilC